MARRLPPAGAGRNGFSSGGGHTQNSVNNHRQDETNAMRAVLEEHRRAMPRQQERRGRIAKNESTSKPARGQRLRR